MTNNPTEADLRRAAELANEYDPAMHAVSKDPKALVLAGILAERERAAKVAEKRAEQRFAEFGTREWDTNATYYSGRYGETLEVLDEEDEAIAAAIRAGEEG